MSFIKIIGKPIFNSLLNLVMLGVAIYALVIAIRTFDNANEQFEKNSRSSDSLFNVQLRYSKQLNDSLINQISQLQEITNSQLKITDEQLEVSKETYRNQLYTGRPKIVLLYNFIKDTSFVFNNAFSPVISTKYTNVGNRNAVNLKSRFFVVYPDFSGIRSSALFPEMTGNFEPEASSTYEFKPRIPVQYKDEFYYCVEFSYYDNILKKEFYFPYYFHYYKNRNEYNFYDCEDNVKPKIKNTINNILKALDIPLFDI
ncbi:MAG: hypothetical protein PVF17_10655 [Ignavibacteria bacterium]|jgi:hypothetical protein